MPGSDIVDIDETKRIATGKWRIVYLHPNDDTKVIKVHRPDNSPAARRARHWYARLLPLSRFDANARDLRLYRRLAARAPQALGQVGAVYGFTETDQGRALVAEHVRDADGRTSESLWNHVARNGLEGVAALLDDFFETFAAHHVPVEDPTYHNILVRRDGPGISLVLIDGLGDPTLIPYKTMFKSLNREKLMRKKGRLIAKLERAAAAGAGT
jgi:hypothetical protein